MKKLVVYTLLCMMSELSTSAMATVWQGPNGYWYSDTCISGDGSYFVFYNQTRLVGTPCWFNDNYGYRHNGHFG